MGDARSCTTRPTPSAARAWPRLAVRPRAPAPRCRRPSARSRSCCRASRPSTREIGNAVGLDTPASAIALLDALRDGGLRRRARLRRRRRADPRAHRRRRPRPRVPHRRAARGRDRRACRSPTTRRGSRRCPQALRDAVDARRGARRRASGTSTATTSCSPGWSSATSSSPSSRRAATARTRSAIYHDPELPPTHHYLAAYRWLRTRLGRRRDRPPRQARHARVAAGQGARARARDARPTPRSAGVPLFYPFVVNDPGEGVQAKRRAHAVIVDHLVPPMMRAETYDELAELEQLLDEYARCEALDPPKLPALAGRIWTLLHEAELHPDLDLQDPSSRRSRTSARSSSTSTATCARSRTSRSGTGCTSSAARPRASSATACWRRSCASARATVPGLRRAVGAAYGLDEPALVERRRAPWWRRARRRCSRASPARRRAARDLVDRLEDAQTRAARRVRRARLRARRRGGARVRRGARPRGRRRRDARCASPATEVVPRLRATTDELDHLLGGLRGRHVPAGPVGLADPRARRRAADRAQLLLRRPPGAALRARLRRRARGWPTRCCAATSTRTARTPRWSGSSRGAPPRCAPTATTSPRSSRCSACARCGTPRRARVAGLEVIAARGARPPADRRRRAHLGLLPRRLPRTS